MGNKYKIMVDITLTYRFFKDVAENSPEFVAEVNTQDLILDLQEKIYEEVKKLNNNFFEIEANDLKLWKVEINNGDNDKFSSLVLPNDDVKNLNKLKEKIVDHWNDEEKRSKEGLCWAENTRLQLAFSNGTIHEGDIVKYKYKDDNITTLRAAEGWAYINHENTFHPTVSSFVKKFLKVSGTSAVNYCTSTKTSFNWQCIS
ncbi:uncharacterized protein OCT59_025801 [Rhizophagus irregularis]|uniref:uncharacterized protein n=1 Tax=Rhizophagus irregularis TaxID=588596 RepID=UPI001D344F5A|nr:hypothetical protein OCT59_025801 [Rhizophagus irregularis]CAG8727121.1 4160_t:CDS:2 [Rhizophagus irregularis]